MHMDNGWRRGYPKLSLGEALEKAKLVYEQEYTHATPRSVIANAMGYSGINGASSRVLSALSLYGLIEPAGEDNYRISNDALNLILHQRGEPERVESVKRLAFNPGLFAELKEKYPNNVPSDENMKAFLVKSGYHPNSVKDIIKAYKETWNFLGEESFGYSKEEGQSDLSEHNSRNIDVTSPQRIFAEKRNDFERNSESMDDDSSLVFKISKNSRAKIIFSGAVTQESIVKLIALLEATMDTYPSEEDLA